MKQGKKLASQIKRMLSNTLVLVLILPLIISGYVTYAGGTDPLPTYGKAYTIGNVLSDYQYFIEGDLTGGGHTIGGVAVGGTLDLNNGVGYSQVSPTYVKNVKNVTEPSNNWAAGSAYIGYANYDFYYDTVTNETLKNASWFQAKSTCNPGYILFNQAFASIRKESIYWSRDKVIQQGTNPYSISSDEKTITITLDKTKDTFVSIPYDKFQKANIINVTGLDDVQGFVNHRYVISITGIGDNKGQEYDLPSFDYPIQFNGVGFGNKLKGLTGGADGNQRNLNGMKLVWNFPDATCTIKTTDLCGHMVAPNATSLSDNGNFEGGIIAQTASAGAEGHFYSFYAPGTSPEPGITVYGANYAEEITTAGGTLQMNAAVIPDNTASKPVTWTVTEKDGVTLTDKATITQDGLLTATKDGPVTVTATAKDNHEIVGSEVITIKGQVISKVPVTQITVSGTGNATRIDAPGGTLQMNAEVKPDNATNKEITWTVENGTGSATISSTGLLTAITDGTVTVKATAKDGSGIVGTKDITITNNPILVTKITVDSQSGASSVDIKSVTFPMLVKELLPTDATDKSVTWSVTETDGSTTTKASIAQDGLLTVKEAGTVTVKAKANDGSNVAGTKDITITNNSIFVPAATPKPTLEPTTEPTSEPTTKPTVTAEPTSDPTTKPAVTAEPTSEPTTNPTVTPKPTVEPTAKPTATPKPTLQPTTKPTVTPEATSEPTAKPAVTPKPTSGPTVEPTATTAPEVTPEPTTTSDVTSQTTKQDLNGKGGAKTKSKNANTDNGENSEEYKITSKNKATDAKNKTTTTQSKTEDSQNKVPQTKNKTDIKSTNNTNSKVSSESKIHTKENSKSKTASNEEKLPKTGMQLNLLEIFLGLIFIFVGGITLRYVKMVKK